MKVQKEVSGNWADERVVIDKVSYTIPAEGSLSLSDIWNSNQVSLTQVGKYRVYAAVVNSKGNVLLDNNDKPLEYYSVFNVVYVRL